MSLSPGTTPKARSVLRRSLPLKIALAISLITLLLITASFWMVIYLLGQDFNDLLPLLASNGGMVHIPAEDLHARGHAFALRSWRVFAITLGVGALAALLAKSTLVIERVEDAPAGTGEDGGPAEPPQTPPSPKAVRKAPPRKAPPRR